MQNTHGTWRVIYVAIVAMALILRAEPSAQSLLNYIVMERVHRVIIGLFMLLAAFVMFGCKSVKVIEKVSYRDSVIMHHHYDTTHVTFTDTSHVEVHHTVITETGTTITFGEGGGTYNSHTGQATNVTGVQEQSSTTEQHDSIADLKKQVDIYKATADSLSEQITNYQSELYEERIKPKRGGWDEFCTLWFIVTAILIIAAFAWWCVKKFYLHK